jgi:hypothetical protein
MHLRQVNHFLRSLFALQIIISLRSWAGVALIRFAFLAGLGGNQRRRDHLAVVSQFNEPPRQHEPRRPRLVADAQVLLLQIVLVNRACGPISLGNYLSLRFRLDFTDGIDRPVQVGRDLSMEERGLHVIKSEREYI